MPQPIAPRSFEGGNDPNFSGSQASIQKTRKISTACGACKSRKTRCSGGNPCDACAARNSACDYDATSDQRRKIANQRNVQDLAEAQHDLDRIRQLTGGMIAIFRAGHIEATNDLINYIRTGVDLSQLAAYVRNEVRTNINIENAFQNIDFHIDGHDLPSPSTLMARLANQNSQASSESLNDPSLYKTDPSLGR